MTQKGVAASEQPPMLCVCGGKRKGGAHHGWRQWQATHKQFSSISWSMVDSFLFEDTTNIWTETIPSRSQIVILEHGKETGFDYI